MHPTAERFAERTRDEYGFDPDIREFSDGTRTAADAAAAIGCDVGQIVKSLAFVVAGEGFRGPTGADGEVVLVYAAGDARVDEEAFAEALGADSVRTAEADEVKEATGWSIGGVPPFAHEHDMRTYVDESLFEHDRIWAAAGTPEAVFELAPAVLREIADPEPVDVFERS